VALVHRAEHWRGRFANRPYTIVIPAGDTRALSAERRLFRKSTSEKKVLDKMAIVCYKYAVSFDGFTESTFNHPEIERRR